MSAKLLLNLQSISKLIQSSYAWNKETKYVYATELFAPVLYDVFYSALYSADAVLVQVYQRFSGSWA